MKMFRQFLCLTLLSIFFIPILNSCKGSVPPEPGDLFECNFTKKEFDRDEKIICNIAIGLRKGYEEYFKTKSHENDHYFVGVTKNTTADFGTSNDLISVYEIKEFPPNVYDYIKTNDTEIKFNFFKQVTIPSSIFADEAGSFYLGMLYFSAQENGEEKIAFSSEFLFHYQRKDNKIKII